jgi:hypothetical protein
VREKEKKITGSPAFSVPDIYRYMSMTYNEHQKDGGCEFIEN